MWPSWSVCLFFCLYASHIYSTIYASSACHRTPTGPSHTRGCVEVSEPLRNEHQWHFDSYSIWGKWKFVSPMYINIPQCRHFCYMLVYIKGMGQCLSWLISVFYLLQDCGSKEFEQKKQRMERTIDVANCVALSCV